MAFEITLYGPRLPKGGHFGRSILFPPSWSGRVFSTTERSFCREGGDGDPPRHPHTRTGYTHMRFGNDHAENGFIHKKVYCVRQNNGKISSGKIILEKSDALGGFAPAAMASPSSDKEALRAISPGSSHCAPSPSGGLVAQEGGIISREKRFSPEQKNIIFLFLRMRDQRPRVWPELQHVLSPAVEPDPVPVPLQATRPGPAP
jgi:hypothetical protein